MNIKLAYHPIIVLAFAGPMAGCHGDKKDLEEIEQEILVDDDYLIFGSFAGFCHGEGCIEIFKMENNRLYEDRNDQYPTSGKLPYQGKFELLPDEKYKLVTDIKESFPKGLFDETKLVHGMPDAYDQGGIYVEIKRNDKIQYWVLDRDTANLPDYLHEWVDLVNEKVSVLR